MADKSIVAYLFRHAEEQPEKPAVIAGGKSADYRRLAELVRGYAAFLREKGLRKGDVVLVKASQSLEHAVVYLAVHAGGVLFVQRRGARLLQA